jgi:hypothetical protein
MVRDLPAAARLCADAIAAMDAGTVEVARVAVGCARRALSHWGTPWPQTEAQVARLLDAPLTTDPVVAAAEWLQLADDKLRGDVVTGDEPYDVREYLGRDYRNVGEPEGAVLAWLQTHRTAYPRTARAYVATARALLAE